MLQLFLFRLTIWSTLVVILSMAALYFVSHKRNIHSGFYCFAIAWLIAIWDAYLWFIAECRGLGSSSSMMTPIEHYWFSLTYSLLVLTVPLVFLVHLGLSWVCAGIGRIPGFSEETSANAGS